MKKSYLIMAAIASVALASCSDEQFVGEVDPGTGQGIREISFASGASGMTRADHVGADAAKMLGGKFYVGGYKNVGTGTGTTSTVFDNYVIKWEANTAEKTTDNTSDWKYVGEEALGFTNHVSGSQTIKYWDFAANYYNFVAYSPGDGNAIITAASYAGNNKILATAIDPNLENLKTAAYTLAGSAEDLKECYIADMITAKKTATDKIMAYNTVVTVKFRSLAAKVRIALYETIPGYSVKDVKFYTAHSDDTFTGASTTNAALFTPSNENAFNSKGTMTVYFPNIGDSPAIPDDYNKAHVKFTPSSSDNTASSILSFYESTNNEDVLVYETTSDNLEDNRLKYEGNTNKYLKRTSTNPSFAGTTDPYYVTVLPDETGNILELRVDYTLESIDGSKEDITIHGATAYIPQIYAAWKPNYAYTYLFKISDNTNGWTSQVATDPKGLYPITFDAVVVDSEEKEQTTITTVATPSITTYQKGHNYATDGPEYKVSATDSIYIQVMNGSTLASDLNTKGQLYTITGDNIANVTEADVMDALNMRTSDANATPVVGRNGFTLTPTTVVNATGDATFGTIPGVDGNPIRNITANTAARFIPTAATYAYVYSVSTGSQSTYYTNVPSNTLTVGTTDVSNYYTFNPTTGQYTKCDPNSTAAANTYYYEALTNLNNVYGVKIIKVVAAQQGGQGNG